MTICHLWFWFNSIIGSGVDVLWIMWSFLCEIWEYNSWRYCHQWYVQSPMWWRLWIKQATFFNHSFIKVLWSSLKLKYITIGGCNSINTSMLLNLIEQIRIRSHFLKELWPLSLWFLLVVPVQFIVLYQLLVSQPLQVSRVYLGCYKQLRQDANRFVWWFVIVIPHHWRFSWWMLLTAVITELSEKPFLWNRYWRWQWFGLWKPCWCLWNFNSICFYFRMQYVNRSCCF